MDQISEDLNSMSTNGYKNLIKEYNELVVQYNTLFDKYGFVVRTANELARRPVIVWTPPTPPKQIYCNTSGNINSFGAGYGAAMNTSTYCRDY